MRSANSMVKWLRALGQLGMDDSVVAFGYPSPRSSAGTNRRDKFGFLIFDLFGGITLECGGDRRFGDGGCVFREAGALWPA
jgi:hypothetical protein